MASCGRYEHSDFACPSELSCLVVPPPLLRLHLTSTIESESDHTFSTVEVWVHHESQFTIFRKRTFLGPWTDLKNLSTIRNTKRFVAERTGFGEFLSWVFVTKSPCILFKRSLIFGNRHVFMWFVAHHFLIVLVLLQNTAKKRNTCKWLTKWPHTQSRGSSGKYIS